MKRFSSEFIRPLGTVENHFLEALLFEFHLKRGRHGSTLQVSLDERAPTVWRNVGKTDVQKRMPGFERKAKEYQERLDALLLEGRPGEWRFRDRQFPFRYASGGTLPIVRFRGDQHYCLFYRDIFPIGWNIANGGCDARRELIDPVVTAERELREELIAIHPKRRKQYVYEAEEGKPLDRPEFADARLSWQKRHPHLGFGRLEEVTIPLQWLDGPDTLVVQFGKEPKQTISGCFLNINALDFGIEIDRVAKISLDEDAVLLDGEVSSGFLLNELIGLFPTDRFNEDLVAGRTDFRPAVLFWDGKEWPAHKLESTRDRFLKYISRWRSRADLAAYRAHSPKFDLCPVTRSIVSRYESLTPQPPRPKLRDIDVFISFGGEDRQLAERVKAFLETRNVSAFCSSRDIKHSSFPRIIDDALDAAPMLLGVATRKENLWRPYVEYEWRSFYTTNILLGRKPDARLVSFTSGVRPVDLPKPFLLNQQVEFTPSGIRKGLTELVRFVP